MAATPDNRPGIQPVEKPRSETIGQAAQKIREMYTVFDRKAPKLTRKYIKERLNGEEGKTWGVFDGTTYPYLDRAIRIDGKIELNARYNRLWEIRSDYKLQQNPLLLPTGEGEFEEKDAITILRPGEGFDPGEKYAIPDNQTILQAKLDHDGPMPTLGSGGHFAWSTSRTFIGKRYGELTEVTPELTDLITKIHVIYEEVKKQ